MQFVYFTSLQARRPILIREVWWRRAKQKKVKKAERGRQKKVDVFARAPRYKVNSQQSSQSHQWRASVCVSLCKPLVCNWKSAHNALKQHCVCVSLSLETAGVDEMLYLCSLCVCVCVRKGGDCLPFLLFTPTSGHIRPHLAPKLQGKGQM